MTTLWPFPNTGPLEVYPLPVNVAVEPVDKPALTAPAARPAETKAVA